MDPQLSDRLTKLEVKLEEIHRSVEQTRKYFLLTLIISAVVFILPLIGFVFALPSLFAYYGDLSAQIQDLNF